MKDFKLGPDGDLVITDYDLVPTDGLDAIVQRLRIKFRLFVGEWFLDTKFGTPWYQTVLKKNPDPGQMEAAFKEVILTTPEVQNILEFDMNLSSERVLTLTFKAQTAQGVIDFNEVL